MALATVSVVAGCQPKGQKSASGSEGASSSSKATITIGFAGGSTVGASRVSSGSSSSSSIIAGGLFGGGAALASSSFPTTGAFFMPGSISDFDCFAVNVIAPDIQTNSACGGMARMGLAGGFVSGHGGLLQLDVPFGAKRTFQIWGFAKSSFCPDVTRLLNLQKGAFPGGANSPGFMLAQTTVDVFQREMTLDIQPKFNFGSTPQMCGSLSAPSTSFDSMVFSGGGHPALPNHSVSNNSTDDVCVKIHTSTSNPAFTCTMVKNGVATALPAGTCTPGVGTGTGTCVGVTNPGGYVFTIPKQGVPGTVQSVSLTITSIDQSYGVIDPSPPTFDFTIDLNLPVLTFSSISPGKQYPGGAWYTTSPSPIGSLTLSKAGTVFETQGFLPPFPGTYSQCNAVSGPAPLLCLINPVLPAFGVYDVSFMANDAAGNLATAISQKVAYINPILTPSLTVSPQDTFTPSLSWLMGGDLDGSAGPAFPNASVVLHASQPGINGELNIVDNTTYLCTIDGAPPVPCGNASAVGGNPIDFTVVASSVHGGKHTLAATASNFAGTPATPINQTVYVDSLVGQPAVGSFYTGDPSLGQVYGGKYLVDASSSNVMMAPMPSDTGLNDPGGVALDPVGDLSTGWLYVADIVNSRVLAYPWDVVQHRLKSHAASFVYGQASLSSVSLGADAANGFPATSAGTWRNQSGFNLSRMLFPFAVAVGNVRNNAGSLRTKLWVSDTFNNRVLQFDVTGGPALNKMKAELILGQDVDTGTTANAHLDMRNDLNFPTGLTFYSQFANQGILYVADTNNCRVVGYDVAAINATTAMPYVGVAKNASFHVAAEGVPFGAGPAVPGGWTCGPNGTGSGGLGSTSLFSPYSVAVDATGAGASPPRIFVGDSGNPRVPYWDLNTATGAPLAPNATGAIGQTDANTFTADGSGGYGVMPTNPRGVALPIAANGHKLVAVSQSTGGSVEWVRFYDVTNYNAISNNYPWITIWNFNSGSGAAASGQRGLNSPSFIYFDSTVNQTFVSDSGNNRIGIWPGTAGSFDQPMLDVVGHSDASGSQYSFIASAANNPNELNLDSPTQATADTRNQHLFVADSGNNRVLVYSLDPNTFKPTSGIATNVIGVALQPTGIPMLDSRAPGSNSTVTAGTLNNPTQVALDPAGRLWVADTGNNRVLRFPTATPSLPVNGISADLVLGQPDFGSFAAGTGLNQMSAPGGIAFDASTDRLYVSDTGNNRILVFNTMSTVTNGATATCFGNSTFAVPIGQCVGGHSGGVNLNALDAPGALWYTNGSSGAVARGLFVADTGNHRVLYYDLTATVNGLPSNAPLSPATMCYGHHGATLAAACSSSLPNDGGTLATKGGFGLSAPTSVFFRETSPPRLFVADKGNARVAVYDFSDCKNSPFSTGGAPCGGVTVFNNSTIFHAIGGRSVTTSFGGPVATPAGLNTPMGVFGLSPSSSPNLLYITDQIWNRVGVYEVP